MPTLDETRACGELPSISELDEAIELVLGSRVYAAVKSSLTGRPHMHDMAIRKAFVQEMSGRHINTLRALALVLDEQGFYPPECFASNRSALSNTFKKEG